ncbi:MAG: ribbon-helix-helix domain-containing protein [Pseudolabrys sp.]
MKTAVLKRSIEINGKKTSISLEDEFWYGLLEIAAYKKMAVPKLVEQIDNRRMYRPQFAYSCSITFEGLPENEDVAAPSDDCRAD